MARKLPDASPKVTKKARGIRGSRFACHRRFPSRHGPTFQYLQPGLLQVIEAHDMTPGAPWTVVSSNVWGRIDSTALPDGTGGLLPGRHYRARVQTN